MTRGGPHAERAASRGACVCIGLLLGWLSSGRALADPDPQRGRDAEVFRYVEPVDAYPFRAALETLGLLGLGTAQYFSNHAANSGDWDYDYTWSDFRTKISGSGYSLDTNRFDTNYLTHPGGGTMYYWAARGNRLSVLASFAYALSASTTWEIVGEFREHASVNDLIVTPISGLVLGETTVQLGAFFDRSCATTANRVLGTLFGLSKSLHDAIDGAQLLRDGDCDRLGFTRRGAHEFRLSIGEGVVVSTAGSEAPPFAETQLALRTRVIALRSYGRPGHGMATFADGNWSELWTRGAFIGSRWSDFAIGARVVPVGLHFRDLEGDAEGPAPVGHEILFGLLIGTEYNVHRYDGGAPASADRFFAIDAPGVSVRYRRHADSLLWELELSTSMTFGGIDALALDGYLRDHARETLTPVARATGYNHVAGLMLSPRARLTTRHVEAGIDLEAIQLWAIRGFDRFPEQHSRVPVAEALRRATAWVAFGPLANNVWLRAWGAGLQRWGSIGDSRASRTELRLGAGIDGVL